MQSTRKLSLIFVLCSLLFSVSACEDFLYEDSDQVIYADKDHLRDDADTLWSVAGIMNKMQVIADRTILLGEVRADLVDITDDASADLRELAYFSADANNKYNQPRDYYAIINNCNYFLAKADTALRNSRNEQIFLSEYAAVKAFRAWTYLQLALNYGSVPIITEPILTKDESEKDYPKYDIGQICRYFISDIAPFADVETPTYNNIRNTASKLFYYPIYVLLGDLNLWAGDYRAAAESYYKYISTRNGTNTAYPLTTNAVRFSSNDSHWASTLDYWSTSSFYTETNTANAELITMIPGDSIPSEGNYSELRDLFNTTENNEYKNSLAPSQSIISLSAAQKYCHYTSGGEYVFAPDGLTENRTGDLRLQAVYNSMEDFNIISNGKRVTHYSVIQKYQTRNVHILRRATIYLRLAEALNRAGFPRFAFQLLKRGVNNSVLESEVIPYYPEAADWLRSFNFPNNNYVLETTAGLASENTMGLHSRGSGYSASNEAYVLPDATLLTSPQARLEYQMNGVEDLIVDEEALELAFEGQRFYDLMRVALRRNDPAYLASRIYARRGTDHQADMQQLIQADLNVPANWYLKWNQ